MMYWQGLSTYLLCDWIGSSNVVQVSLFIVISFVVTLCVRPYGPPKDMRRNVHKKSYTIPPRNFFFFQHSFLTVQPLTLTLTSQILPFFFEFFKKKTTLISKSILSLSLTMTTLRSHLRAGAITEEQVKAALLEASTVFHLAPRAKVLREYVDMKYMPWRLAMNSTGFHVGKTEGTDCISVWDIVLPDSVSHDPRALPRTLMIWCMQPIMNAETPLPLGNSRAGSQSSNAPSGSSGSRGSSLQSQPCEVGDDTLRICCVEGCLERERATLGTCCFILEKHVAKSVCCGGPGGVAQFYCYQCKLAFCGKKGCRRSAGHDHPLRNDRKAVSTLRSPCPQWRSGDDGTIVKEPREYVFRCTSCDKVTCDLCLDRVVGVLVVENIPNDWSDGRLVESLEVSLKARIVGFARDSSKHAFVQFDRQILRLGTQCIKLTWGDSVGLQLKPPHVPRRLPAPQSYSVVVEVRGLVAETNKFAVLADLCTHAGIAPHRIMYARKTRAPFFSIHTEVSDGQTRHLLETLNFIHHDDILFPVKVTRVPERCSLRPLVTWARPDGDDKDSGRREGFEQPADVTRPAEFFFTLMKHIDKECTPNVTMFKVC